MKYITASIIAFAAGVLFVGTAVAADLAAGKQKAEQVCAACHGANGVSAVADFPKLAGQYNEYLIRALKDYKSGARKNPIMADQASKLSERDIDDVAAYFSSLQALSTKY